MKWIFIAVFLLVGIYFILKRKDATRGLSYSFGANVGVGCSVSVGFFFFLLALLFFLYLK